MVPCSKEWGTILFVFFMGGGNETERKGLYFN